MNYPSHYISRANSRKRKLEDFDNNNILCEYCGINKACNIHHIECSYHGNKKRNEEGYQLLAVCFNCHNNIHAKNNFYTRENCKLLAKKYIKG